MSQKDIVYRSLKDAKVAFDHSKFVCRCVGQHQEQRFLEFTSDSQLYGQSSVNIRRLVGTVSIYPVSLRGYGYVSTATTTWIGLPVCTRVESHIPMHDC